VSISESCRNTGKFYRENETLLNALHGGFRSAWTSKPEEDHVPFTETELERCGREVRQSGKGYDAYLRPHKAPIMVTEWIPTTFF